MVRPSGTVTFLFTDVEGSTRRWEASPDEMRALLSAHDSTLRAAIEAHGGWLFKHTGDGICAVFASARAAIAAAVDAQRGLLLPVRMGLTTGEAEESDGDYFGPTLNRAARLMGAGHGGQVLVSAATERLLEGAIGPDWRLLELGEFQLKDLSAPEVVFQVVTDGLPVEFPPLRTLTARQHNLPVQLTSFIGRDEQVAALVGEVLDHRLITIVAGGGVGKTRLALQAAAELVDGFDGVYLSELAPLRDPAGIAGRIVESLGYVAAGASPSDIDRTLVERVGGRRCLLVVDNCEHVVAECARVVSLLLTRCPHLHVITTSRQPLGLPGEQLWAVGGLEAPHVGADPAEVGRTAAGALFLERARAVRSDFEITDTNATAVVSICRSVEGLPLALELAAARVRSLAVGDIAVRLGRSLKVLAGPARPDDVRHRTIEDCLAWSFDSLPDGAARILRRLSVFAGGATLDACQVVCAGEDLDQDDVEEHLVELVDRSLVELVEVQGVGRYRLHELVRQYATARLSASGEAGAVKDRHLAWCAGLVLRYSPGLRSLNDPEAASRLLADVDNLSVGVSWGLERKDTVALVRLLGGGGEMWAHANLMRQVADWWTATLPLLPDTPEADFPAKRLALALVSAAAANMHVARYPVALQLLDRAKRIDSGSNEVTGLHTFADLYMQGCLGGEATGLVAGWQELVATSTANGSGIELASRTLLGIWLVLTADPARLRPTIEPARWSPEPGAIEQWAPLVAILEGLAAVLDGHVEVGLAQVEAVCAAATPATTRYHYLVFWLGSLGHLLAARPEDAATAVLRSLRETWDSPYRWPIVCTVEAAALLAADLGERQLAAEALASIDHEFESYGHYGRPLSLQPVTVLNGIRRRVMEHLEVEGSGSHAIGVEEMSDRMYRWFKARVTED